VRGLIDEGVWCDVAVPEVVSTKMLASLSLDGKVNVASNERLGEAIRIGRALAQAHCDSRDVKVQGQSEKLWAVRNGDTWKRRGNEAWVVEVNKTPLVGRVGGPRSEVP